MRVAEPVWAGASDAASVVAACLDAAGLAHRASSPRGARLLQERRGRAAFRLDATASASFATSVGSSSPAQLSASSSRPCSHAFRLPGGSSAAVPPQPAGAAVIDSVCTSFGNWKVMGTWNSSSIGRVAVLQAVGDDAPRPGVRARRRRDRCRARTARSRRGSSRARRAAARRCRPRSAPPSRSSCSRRWKPVARSPVWVRNSW